MDEGKENKENKRTCVIIDGAAWAFDEAWLPMGASLPYADIPW
jgi:hypothetical protein